MQSNETNRLREVQGDLISLFKRQRFDVILHNCNCCHTMIGSLANEIKVMFPKVIEVDHNTVFGDYKKLGTFSTGFTKSGKIINLYVQLMPGSFLEYASLVKVLHRVNKHYKGKHIGISKENFECFGGDWKIIKKIITELLTDVDLTIVNYDKRKNTLGN